MEEKHDNIKNSRRKFLANGASAGAGVLLGAQIVKELSTDEEVVLITADGTLVRVDKRHMPAPTGKKLRNKDINDWKNSE